MGGVGGRRRSLRLPPQLHSEIAHQFLALVAKIGDALLLWHNPHELAEHREVLWQVNDGFAIRIQGIRVLWNKAPY